MKSDPYFLRQSLPPARILLGGLGLVAAITVLLCLPFLHAVYWLGDEGVLLRGAAELSAGHKIYNDFFAFCPPGGYLILQGWLTLFGQSFTGVRVFAILTIVAIASLSYLACLLASRNVALSAFLALAWVATAKTTWLVGISHHWLTTLLSMASACFTLAALASTRPNAARAAWAGLAGGAAAMVTSSCGLLAAIATTASFLDLRVSRRALAACVAGALAVPLLCLAYIIINGAFTQAYDQIVRFTLTQYAADQKVPYGTGLLWYYPDQYLFPLSGLLALALVLKSARAYVLDPPFRACVFYALAGLAGAYPRPDVVHICFTLPLGLPLAAYGASCLTANWLPLYRRLAFVLAVLWCLPAAVGLVHRGIVAWQSPLTATAAGPVSLLGDEKDGGAEIFAFLATTPPTQSFFFYPWMPLMSYLAERPQASRFDVFAPGYTSPAQYLEACEAVTHQADWVIIDGPEIQPKSWLTAFPTLKNPTPPESMAFEQALEQNFPLTRQIGIFQIRQRTPQTSDAGCAKIRPAPAPRN